MGNEISRATDTAATVIPSIGHLAGFAARRFGDRAGFTFIDGPTLSFTELDARAAACAGGLAALGIGAGDRVILHLPNDVEWLVVYHAIARMRAVVVPANILLSPGEISYIAQDSGAKLLVAPAAKLAGITTGSMIVVTPEGTEGTLKLASLTTGSALPPMDGDPGDLFTIGYTSGTTGRPKGAVLSHANIFASAAGTATIHVRTEHDRIYCALPFPHVYGNVLMNACLLTGGELIVPERFDPAEALRIIGEKRITLFEGVPTMYYQMLMQPEVATADFSSLKRCTVGGQSMALAKFHDVSRIFGVPLLELWGMTEVGGPATSHSPYWPQRPGSIGLPFPGIELRIASLDDPALDAGPGDAGELMIRGPLVMQGYWNNAAATSAVLDAQGWLATGDIARREADGHTFIVDRRKDMILTAGYNVYPAELEQVIAAHPDVAMVAVTGIPDDEKGELAIAYVVRHPAAAVDEAALFAHCRLSLAAYKIPRRVHFVDDLPRTSTGKIMRRALGASGPAKA